MTILQGLQSNDMQIFSLYCNIVWKEQGTRELFNLLYKNGLSQNRGFTIENNNLWVWIIRKIC